MEDAMRRITVAAERCAGNARHGLFERALNISVIFEVEA
jgi:hypothetical protein